MDNPVCVSCHKGLSLEDIERGHFKHIGGRLYCGECVARMRRVGPVPCPQCGTRDTPLYTGTGYQCRKCGAPLQPTPQAAKSAAPQHPRTRPATKACPYCGAALLADALKCRYCGASLTREARDLDAFSRQNSQLRFWVGCLLSASVFLVLSLFYALATRGSQTGAAQAPAPTPAAPAKADPNAEVVRELRDELRAVRTQIAALEAEQQRLAAARAAAPSTSRMPKALADALRPPTPGTEGATPRPAPVKGRPAAKEPAEKAPAPKEPTPPTKAIAVAPPPTPAPKEPVPPPTEVPKAKAAERTAAQLAAAAYPVFATELDKLKAARRYGDAFGACRQFLAAHLGTPESEKVQAAQKALHEELGRIRDDHARRFRQALDKGDIEASRRVVAELTQYDAPEAREDRGRMLAEIKAGERKPTLDLAKYLGQWEAPPNVARLLQDLTNPKDWTVRSRAAKELGRIGHRAAVRGLIETLKDQEFYVKSCAINALSEIGDPVALPALVPLTRASFPVVYDTAARACCTLAAAPRAKFADAWKLIDPKAVARGIAEALKVQDKEESPATWRYQTALIETLALLDAKETAPVIRPLFEKAKDPALRKAAADAIRKLTGEALMPEPPPAEPPKETPKAAPPPAKAPEPKAAPSAPSPK
ncbi:MAG TPA: HEAT repeat domain-containing protein [Planctomycetota bacterium]|nr:HEAT repeat domain-containing protein [Planctomycetota bacterium]